jgi:hypothetical protein
MSELRQPTSGRAKFLILLTAAAMTAVPAMAVAAPPPTAPPATASPAPRTAAPAQRPANPDYAPDQPDTSEAAPVPAPLPPAVWDAASAAALLQYIEQIGVEGLNPADYDPEGLKAALASGDPVALSAIATDRFDRVSSDLALGHVKKPARVDWYIVDKDLGAEKQDALLRSALAQHDIPGALNGLLPTHPQYAAH